jgi:hypothetical protein
LSRMPTESSGVGYVNHPVVSVISPSVCQPPRCAEAAFVILSIATESVMLYRAVLQLFRPTHTSMRTIWSAAGIATCSGPQPANRRTIHKSGLSPVRCIRAT